MTKISFCERKNIIRPSTLLHFKYEIDPYSGCEHHCYYCYALNDTTIDWNREIIVHRDYPRKLADELVNLEPQPIFIGMDTDPYQAVEREFRHTRETLNLFARTGFTPCILTKSESIIRDIDLLSRIQGASAGFTFAFHDDNVRSLFEKKASSNDKKIFALKKLHEAKIETYALISPIMPFLTDADRIIDVIKDYADTIWFYRLDVNSENDVNWRNIQMILRKNMPEMLREFKEISFSSYHAYWDSLRQKLQNRMINEKLNLEIRF